MRRCRRAQRRVERILNPVTDFVEAIVYRQVQFRTAGKAAAQAADNAVVDHFPGKLRREPGRVQAGAGIVDGTVREPQRQQLADAGAPVEETAGLVLVGVITEAIQFERLRDGQRCVGKKQCLFTLRLPPDLRRTVEITFASHPGKVIGETGIKVVRYPVAARQRLLNRAISPITVGKGIGSIIGHTVHCQAAAGRLQRRQARVADGNVVRLGAVGRISIGILSAYADKPLTAQWKPGVGFEGDLLTVALRVTTVPGAQVEPGAIAPEVEVDDAGDSVGSILGRGAVPE